MSPYIAYADEAWTHDPENRFWRFYGGALLRAAERERIERELNGLKATLGLEGEMKWTQVRPFNWERVAVVLDRFLDFVDERKIKLRYMWLDQAFQDPDALSTYHIEYGYYILYYFFLVFGLGLPWHDDPDGLVSIEYFLDTLPDQPEKREAFRRFLLRAHNFKRFDKQSRFRIVSVGDVDSKKHVILQCVDVIIGAVGFRLNHQHKAKKKNGRRAEATKTKEQLYNRIRLRLGQIDMAERGGLSYAVGVNTGKSGDVANRWRHKFRQWDFRKPGSFNVDWARE
jgi:hypothetical protein